MFCLLLLWIVTVCGNSQEVELKRFPPKDPEISTLLEELTVLKQELREEALTLREEATGLQKESLSLREEILTLRKESFQMQKEMYDLIKSQRDQTTNSSGSHEVLTDLVQEVNELKSLVSDTQETALQQCEVQLPQVQSNLVKLLKVVDVMRSEVRLISQQKLAWQNSTHGEWQPDFIVDGVYTLSRVYSSDNPFQHNGNTRQNNVVMVDLGATFKIHTVKLWNRLDGGRERHIGVDVFAGETLIGTITDQRHLFNFPVQDTVYASKVYLRNRNTGHMMFIELQVFGTGPYADDEVLS